MFEDIQGQSNWGSMVQKFASGVERSSKGCKEVIGIGHSFGGALMLCAAARQAPLFDRIIVFDPPVFSLPKRVAFSFILKYVPHLAPVVFPPLRPRKQTRWQSLEEASNYLRNRGAVFREISEDCFQAFLRHGLKPQNGGAPSESSVEWGVPGIPSAVDVGVHGGEGGVELSFPADLEARLFKTAPMDIPLFSNSMMGLYRRDGGSMKGHFLFSQVSPSLMPLNGCSAA